MSRTAKLMIHAGRATVIATAKELLRQAENLKALDERFAVAFAARTGQPLEVCRHWFAGEDHWFNSAEKAIAAGLADEVA